MLKFESIYDELPTQILIIEEIKKPLLEGIAVIFDPTTRRKGKLKAAIGIYRALKAVSKLPEPTIEETWHPNCHNLIKLRDDLLLQLNLGKLRMGFIRNIFNFVIILYNFDPPWRWIIDSVKDQALEMEWIPRGFSDDWKDDYDWWQDPL